MLNIKFKKLLSLSLIVTSTLAVHNLFASASIGNIPGLNGNHDRLAIGTDGRSESLSTLKIISNSMVEKYRQNPFGYDKHNTSVSGIKYGHYSGDSIIAYDFTDSHGITKVCYDVLSSVTGDSNYHGCIGVGSHPSIAPIGQGRFAILFQRPADDDGYTEITYGIIDVNKGTISSLFKSIIADKNPSLVFITTGKYKGYLAQVGLFDNKMVYSVINPSELGNQGMFIYSRMYPHLYGHNPSATIINSGSYSGSIAVAYETELGLWYMVIDPVNGAILHKNPIGNQIATNPSVVAIKSGNYAGKLAEVHTDVNGATRLGVIDPSNGVLLMDNALLTPITVYKCPAGDKINLISVKEDYDRDGIIWKGIYSGKINDLTLVQNINGYYSHNKSDISKAKVESNNRLANSFFSNTDYPHLSCLYTVTGSGIKGGDRLDLMIGGKLLPNSGKNCKLSGGDIFEWGYGFGCSGDSCQLECRS